MGVFQMQNPGCSFDATRGFKFDIATFDYLAGGVVAIIMPFRQRAFVSKLQIQAGAHDFHIADGGVVRVNNSHISEQK